MATIVIITLVIIMTIFEILSFVYRKPGPKGDKGDKGRDGFMCDDLTIERIKFLLQNCEELDLSGTTIKVKEIRKPKKGGN